MYFCFLVVKCYKKYIQDKFLKKKKKILSLLVSLTPCDVTKASNSLVVVSDNTQASLFLSPPSVWYVQALLFAASGCKQSANYAVVVVVFFGSFEKQMNRMVNQSRVCNSRASEPLKLRHRSNNLKMAVM